MKKEDFPKLNDRQLVRAYGFALYHRSTTEGLGDMYDRLDAHVKLYEEEMKNRNIPLTAKEGDYE